MEEVKTRLKRKGDEIEELKKAALEKKKRLLKMSRKQTSSRVSYNGSPANRRITLRS